MGVHLCSCAHIRPILTDDVEEEAEEEESSAVAASANGTSATMPAPVEDSVVVRKIPVKNVEEEKQQEKKRSGLWSFLVFGPKSRNRKK